MSLVKYMGSADIRRILKGEDFAGQLSKEATLDRDIEWNQENRWVIDTADFDGVDDEFWTALLEQPDFKDVSGLKRVPTNEAQQIWHGMAKTVDGDDAESGVKSSGPADAEVGDSSPTKAAAAAKRPGPSSTI